MGFRLKVRQRPRCRTLFQWVWFLCWEVFLFKSPAARSGVLVYLSSSERSTAGFSSQETEKGPKENRAHDFLWLWIRHLRVSIVCSGVPTSPVFKPRKQARERGVCFETLDGAWVVGTWLRRTGGSVRLFFFLLTVLGERSV